jgi:hypothetical protein
LSTSRAVIALAMGRFRLMNDRKIMDDVADALSHLPILQLISVAQKLNFRQKL